MTSHDQQKNPPTAKYPTTIDRMPNTKLGDKELKHPGAVFQIDSHASTKGRIDITRWLKCCQEDDKDPSLKRLYVAVRGHPAKSYFAEWLRSSKATKRAIYYLPEGIGEGKPENKYSVRMLGTAPNTGRFRFSYYLGIVEKKLEPQVSPVTRILELLKIAILKWPESDSLYEETNHLQHCMDDIQRIVSNPDLAEDFFASASRRIVETNKALGRFRRRLLLDARDMELCLAHINEIKGKHNPHNYKDACSLIYRDIGDFPSYYIADHFRWGLPMFFFSDVAEYLEITRAKCLEFTEQMKRAPTVSNDLSGLDNIDVLRILETLDDKMSRLAKLWRSDVSDRFFLAAGIRLYLISPNSEQFMDWRASYRIRQLEERERLASQYYDSYYDNQRYYEGPVPFVGFGVDL